MPDVLRPVLRPVLRDVLGRPLTPIKGGGDIIRSIFADGTDGFYFDFSKTDRLFQAADTFVPANDPGESIGVGFESHAWGSKSFAQEVASLANQITNGDNESVLMTSAFGVVSATRGTVARSTDRAVSGVASAKFLCNTATSGAHYINLGAIPAASALYLRAKMYLPTGSLARLCFVDQNDGSWIPVLTTTKDQWVTVEAIRPAKGTNWILVIGNDTSESVDGQAFYVDDLEIYVIPGNHGAQATAAAKPKFQTGGLARFDGSDDNLLTTLSPAASFSMMFKGKITSASKVAMGSRATLDTRVLIGTDASGLLAGGVGADSTPTIKGGSDIRGATGVGALVFDASTVTLYWNAASIYSGALNGSPNTSVPLRLGCLNDAGTAAIFADADIYHALAIKKALTAAEIAAITNLWGTS